MFNHFFEIGEFEHRFFRSFILLIFKISYPSSLNGFRPILLLGWVHKLVHRVLAAKLRSVTGKLVWDSQSTFIRGKSIFEGCTVASMVLEVNGGYGVEIDFEKTYDCVD